MRGLIDKDLTPELALHLGKAFGTYLKRNGNLKTAVVGFDSRATGPEYAKGLIEGLNWAGIDVIDIGMQLVGIFYWSQYHFKSPGGVFITASHNPPQFNGFKFANDYSETLVTDGMMEMRRLVEEEDYERGEKPGVTEKEDVQPAYFNDLLGRLQVAKKFKVVIDSSNSTAGAIAPQLFRKFGCEVIEYNTEIKETFLDGTADPTEAKVVKRLAEEVMESRADVGFTYDADGDRIGIVDEKGGIIWNDVLVALMASDVLKDHPGTTIMFNTLCSKAVPETIIKEGGKPFMWRTGHSFLKKKNQEIKAAYIGELSGHFFFSADFYNHDDGLYSTLRLLQYLSRTNQKLSEAVAHLPQYISSPEIKLYCDDDKKVKLMDKLSPVLKIDYPQAKITDDLNDGVRFDLPEAMFVIRYSHNGPYVTIKFEAKTQKEYEDLRDYISKLLHSYPEIDWESEISLNLEALL